MSDEEGDGPGPDTARRLLKLGLAEDEGQWFGGYRLIRTLGRGGMGAVFLAECEHIQRRVALKRLIEPDLATESELRRFLFGAESQASLDHPNIVRVFHVDTHRGRPYFTMEYVSGGHLGELLAERRGEQGPGSASEHLREDLELMRKLADAVHYAHTYGLLHRDLKPANILMEKGEPRIADFGLAKRLEPGSVATETGMLAGTLAYMSPEQAAGKTLDRRADIYGLGTIFYELLTGRQQFDDTPLQERLARIKSDEPVQPPRELVASVPVAVEAVCLKCLEKDPDRRYSNALALRDDLQNLLDRRPTSIVPPSLAARVVHRARRNPAGTRRAGRILLASVGLLVLVLYGYFAADRAERAALATNAFIATAQAGAVLFQLREYADKLERTARDPGVIAASELAEISVDPPRAMLELAEDVDTVFIVSGDGTSRATTFGLIRSQWPLPSTNMWDRNYAFRDYFRGAVRLASRGETGTYLARALRSERDGELKFGVSTPVYRDGSFRGVLVALLATDSAFGRLRMKDENGGRITALIGPRDVDRNQPIETGDPKRFVFLIHDGIRRGEEVRALDIRALRSAFRQAAPPGQQFLLATHAQTDADYRDPVHGYEGPWHAAFAPIGATGYVMVVQSRKSAVLSFAATWQLLRPAVPWLSAVAALACAVALVVAWRGARGAR